MTDSTGFLPAIKRGTRYHGWPALLAVLALASCATKPLEFVPVAAMQSQQTVELTTIADLEQIVEQKRIRIIYYTAEYFIADVNSVLYLLKSRGYTNFHDYKEGKLAAPEEYSIFKPGYPLKRK